MMDTTSRSITDFILTKRQAMHITEQWVTLGKTYSHNLAPSLCALFGMRSNQTSTFFKRF